MLSQESSEGGYVNNFQDVQPTVDGALDTRLELLGVEFIGKATRGTGAGGANDPLQPFQQDKPNVMHVNDVGRQAFDDTRGRSQDAATMSFGRLKRHDRQIGPLHPMDYEPDPSVGHRQVDRPEYTKQLFEDRFNRNAPPSTLAKRDTVLPGPADTDSGYRRTVHYHPALFTARPIMRAVRNAAVRAVPTREVQAATMADMGKSDNPLQRLDPFHGRRRKVSLNTLGGDREVADNVPAPRSVLRDKSEYTRAKVYERNREANMNALLNAERVTDNVLPGDRAFFDYYQTGEDAEEGEGGSKGAFGDEKMIGKASKIIDAVHDPVGSDYDLVPTGRSRSSGVGSGSATLHTSVPTHVPVRKPQHSTSAYKHTNLMDAQRVFGDGGAWGFGTPVRASVNKGNAELFRHDGRRRQGGYERPVGFDGVADYMLNGKSTRGKDFNGGRGNNVYEAVRQPVENRSRTASQRAPVGEFGGTRKQLPMDTLVAPRGGELWSRTQLLTNPFATKHDAFYDLAKRSSMRPQASPGAPRHDAMHSHIVREGGYMPNPPATAPGTSQHGGANTASESVPQQLAIGVA